MQQKFIVVVSFFCFTCLNLIGQNNFQALSLSNYLSTYHLNPYSYLLFDELLLSNNLSTNIQSASTIQVLDSIYSKDGRNVFQISNELIVHRRSGGTYKLYRLLASNSDLYVLCARLEKGECDCKEDLYVYSIKSNKPILVRKLFPFSLKVNLIDRINEFSEESLSFEEYNTTCDVITEMRNR